MVSMRSPAAMMSTGLAEAHRIAEQMAHGAPRIGEPGFGAAVAGEPGALEAGQISRETGDDAEKRAGHNSRAAWGQARQWSAG